MTRGAPSRAQYRVHEGGDTLRGASRDNWSSKGMEPLQKLQKEASSPHISITNFFLGQKCLIFSFFWSFFPANWH